MRACGQERQRCCRVGVRKSKQKVLAGWISHGQCYAPNERTRGWFPLTIAGLLGFQLSNFPICRFVGKLAGRCRGGSRRGWARRWVRSGTGWRGRARVGQGTAGGVIAECSACIVQASAAGSAGGWQRYGFCSPAWVVGANLPTFRHVGFSTFRLLGKLESWRGGLGSGSSSGYLGRRE